MATITSLTAAGMYAIRDIMIISGSISGDNLILTKYNGTTVNAGNVRGPAGTNALLSSELGNAVNLDTLKAPAVYTQTSDSEAAAGTSYPVPYGGILTVRSDNATAASATIAYQEYRVIGSSMWSGLVYARTYVSSTWSAWTVISGEGPWQSFPFNTTDWTDYGVFRACQFRLSLNGVRLRGLAKNLNALSSTSTIGTLPAGARPGAPEVFVAVANAGQVSGAASTGTAHTHTTPLGSLRLDITTAGAVNVTLSSTVTLAAGAFVSLSPFRFDLV